MLNYLSGGRFLKLLVSFLLFCLQANAQAPPPGAYAYQAADTSLASVYGNGMGGYKNLYSGTEYIGSYPGTTGHPNFGWDTLRQAVIRYDGVTYQNIGLKYDLVSNEVVLQGRQNLLISLVPQKIGFFSIEGHLFIAIRQDSTQQAPGFYEVLYNGPTTVLAKRRKQVQRGARVEDPYIFRQYDSYFVRKNGVYHPVDGEKDLLSLFSDQREALKTYVREKGRTFKNNEEKRLVATAAYYDQLKN